MVATPVPSHARPGAVESQERAELRDGPLRYTLRRSRRARRLRLVVDPVRGVVVTIPSGRPGSRDAAAHVVPFLVEREGWIRRHLAAQERARLAVAGSRPDDLVDGARLLFRGRAHRLRIEPARSGQRRSSVVSGWSALDVAGDPVDLVETASGVSASSSSGSRRRIGGRSPSCSRRGCAAAQPVTSTRRSIATRPRSASPPAGVSVRDPRTRWGSASRSGRLAFSWRLVLAPPEALETVVVHELAHLRVFGHGPAFWAVVASRVPDHLAWRRWLREHSVELHAALAADRPA